MIRRRNKWSSYAINSALALGVALAGWGAWRMVSDTAFLLSDHEEVEKEISALSAKKGGLESRLAALKIKEVVEREAKERLNLKLPGEEVIVVIPKENASEGQFSENPSTLAKMLKWFKSLFR